MKKRAYLEVRGRMDWGWWKLRRGGGGGFSGKLEENVEERGKLGLLQQKKPKKNI